MKEYKMSLILKTKFYEIQKIFRNPDNGSKLFQLLTRFFKISILWLSTNELSIAMLLLSK